MIGFILIKRRSIFLYIIRSCIFSFLGWNSGDILWKSRMQVKYDPNQNICLPAWGPATTRSMPFCRRICVRMCAILRLRRIITGSCIMRASRQYIIRRWTSSIAPWEERLRRSLFLQYHFTSSLGDAGPCYVPPPRARCNMKLPSPPRCIPTPTYVYTRATPSHPLLCLIFFRSPNSRGARRAHKFLAGAKLNLPGIRCTRIAGWNFFH